MAIGWGSVVAFIVAWCLAILHFSVEWEDFRTPRIEEGRAWTASGVELQIESVTTLEAIPSSYGAGQEPTPGAVFLLVTIRYAFLSMPADTNLVCTARLFGDHRSWSWTSLSWSEEDLLEVTNNCPAVDRDDNPITSGIMGAVFEVPANLVGEVAAVHVSVMVPIPAKDDEIFDTFHTSSAFFEVHVTV